MSRLRLAVVADVHHGRDQFTKKGSAALPLVAEFARFVADARPDAVVDLGDRISDEDPATDRRLAAEAAAAFREVPAPVHHLCGNHDLDHLTVADNAAALGRTLDHAALDLGDWTLVLWRADAKIRRPGGFLLTEADLLRLAGAVRTATKPLVIASHVPLSGHAQTGNYYFERNPRASTYPGLERVRAVLAQARVPVLAIAGHVHWNTLTHVDGIPHVTVQSLTETFTTHPEPAAAWALIELGDAAHLRVFGRDPFEARLDVAATARRWLPPLPPFAEHPEIRARRAAAPES